VVIPDLAREPCVAAGLPSPPHPTREELEIHAILQLGELEVCERKRALGVAAGDLHNLYVDRLQAVLRPATFWERLTGAGLRRGDRRP